MEQLYQSLDLSVPSFSHLRVQIQFWMIYDVVDWVMR